MTRYVALLRGINVGGRQKVRMADLREMLGALGHDDVTTYLQSGNAVFTTTREDTAELAHAIEDRIEHDLGLQVTVLLRAAGQLASVIDANPFPEATADPKTLHVGFLSGTAETERLSGLDLTAFKPDEVAFGSGVVYLLYPNGAGRSKLTTDVLERRLGVRVTARNWNTVTKLLDLVSC